MNKTQATVLLLLLCLLASTETATASTWKPGVASGDYFYYTMYGVYETNQSNLVIPEFEYNNTDWTRINITQIQDSIVNQIYTLHYKNGSETSFSFKCNVDPANRATLQFNEKGVPLCAANLTVGDTVPTDETIIDETVKRTYVDGARETNHAFWNASLDWGDLYFDKETGILVELHRTHRFVSNGSGEVVDKTDVIKITGTNKWRVNASKQQPFMPLFAASVAVIFAFLALAVFLKRLTMRHARAQPFG